MASSTSNNSHPNLRSYAYGSYYSFSPSVWDTNKNKESRDPKEMCDIVNQFAKELKFNISCNPNRTEYLTPKDPAAQVIYNDQVFKMEKAEVVYKEDKSASLIISNEQQSLKFKVSKSLGTGTSHIW